MPFHQVSHVGIERDAHEAALLDVVGRYDPECLVLAKYMRILSPGFVRHFPARIVNIHHSFLPAFVGARPYHQAFHRGVKVIGATAHFVTDELDQGPIILQQVIPVDHSYTPADLAQAGRDVEQVVLARALRLVFCTATRTAPAGIGRGGTGRGIGIGTGWPGGRTPPSGCASPGWPSTAWPASA